MAKEPFEYRLEIIMKEWDYTQTHIGRYDTIIFTIRGALFTIIAAMLSAAVTLRYPSLMLFAVVPVLGFWAIDALNKSNQRVFSWRSRAIDAYLSSAQFDEDIEAKKISFFAPHLASHFGAGTAGARLNLVFQAGLLPNVLVNYAAVLILCAVSYIALVIRS